MAEVSQVVMAERGGVTYRGRSEPAARKFVAVSRARNGSALAAVLFFLAYLFAAAIVCGLVRP
jgi:hypothetical protein